MSKELVAAALAAKAQDNETIGVGTGTTVDLTIYALAERVKNEGLRISVIPTSIETAQLCAEVGLTVLSPFGCARIPWGFDGADAVDSKLRLIKGHGGALLQEKILAARCARYIVVVDSSKLVDNICERVAIPVEVVPSALSFVQDELANIGAASVTLRSGSSGKHGPVITEQGNCILDVRFPSLREGLAEKLKSLVGVVETGLFIGFVDELLIGHSDRVESRMRV